MATARGQIILANHNRLKSFLTITNPEIEARLKLLGDSNRDLINQITGLKFNFRKL